jgi:hypothetical protein
MIRSIDDFYLQKEEPEKSCFLALRTFILNYNAQMTETWKYGTAFFCYKEKMFCYLWTDKKTKQPYIGIVQGIKIDHPALIQGNRTRMKILMIDPEKDLPVKTMNTIFKEAIKFYK